MTDAVLRRRYRLDRPIDLWGTIGPLRFGRDPSWLRLPSGYAKATLTPNGPGAEVVSVSAASGEVSGEFYGSGRDWLADRLPGVLGADDDVGSFTPPDVLASLWRRRPGLRVPRSGLVFEAFVPVVLGQKVTGVEAFASYRRLVMQFGTPVGCGPFPELIVPPSASVWATIPSWAWHRAGVGPQRSRTIVNAAHRADALERLAYVPTELAASGLRSLPGVGEWTAAEVAQRALGDADALSIGDFHVARNVVFALTGRIEGTDPEMVELLAPWIPHRHRIQRLVELARIRPARRGPRYRGHDFRVM